MSSHAFVLLCILWLSLELNKWIINGYCALILLVFFFPFAPWNAHCWEVLHLYFPLLRKSPHPGPSYTARNLFDMWNSISACFGEGRTPATYPVLHGYHTSVVIYRDGWSYMYHCTNTGRSILLGTKGAGTMSMKRISVIFMMPSTCSSSDRRLAWFQV